ncbi:hypothetical protein BSIN_0389 [Burkholderia singularis]|uniref:Uncharacterized protein n=1 Tax=Burkholderia singularis TaxID=1503053 RepID=A0A238H5Y9_9BURK|nr:hypothetical protein BSIN_0389 [Burkholderia singularis]
MPRRYSTAQCPTLMHGDASRRRPAKPGQMHCFKRLIV